MTIPFWKSYKLQLNNKQQQNRKINNKQDKQILISDMNFYYKIISEPFSAISLLIKITRNDTITQVWAQVGDCGRQMDHFNIVSLTLLPSISLPFPLHLVWCVCECVRACVCSSWCDSMRSGTKPVNQRGDCERGRCCRGRGIRAGHRGVGVSARPSDLCHGGVP